jgi:biotin carboxylase
VARILLILPSATYRARDFTEAATRLGADLVVASDRRQAMSAFLGDRALVLPLDRPAEAARRVVEHAARVPLDAVVAVDDQGVRTAALAAAELGLKTSDPEAVARTRDKAAMREALALAGVPQPDYRVVGARASASELASELGFPVVVKPLSLSASRGVIRADDDAEVDAAVARIRAMLDDPGEPLLVESFVPGAEVAVEGVLRGGALETLAVFDKPDPLDGPYFEETIYVTPSRLPAEAIAQIEATASAAATALGLSEGPVHAELRVDGDRVTLLELAARSIGGLCSRALRFGAGVSLEEVILRHALDRPLAGLERADAASGVMMVPIPRAGVLHEVRGQDDARGVPGIVGLEIGIANGRPVQPLPEGDRYLGFLFARGATPGDVEAALRDAHARLEIDIRDPETASSRRAQMAGRPLPGGANRA